jgi:alpha-tubulin suppressor-like RCC1 family protein
MWNHREWSGCIVIALAAAACGAGCAVRDAGEPLTETRIGALSLPWLGRATALSAYSDICALLDNGGVACWGRGDSGQIGNGLTVDSAVPTAVSGLSDAIAVATGYSNNCAVRANGRVVCWGWGLNGELGNGSLSSSSTPVTVSGVSDAVAVTVGQGHGCALRATGNVVCWGSGNAGQLGDGTSTNSSTPVTVAGLTDAVAIAAGALHTCAIRAGGTVVCWGPFTSASPVAVTGITDAVSITGSGLSETCALRATGTVVCWEGSSTPVAVPGLTDAVYVDAGSEHQCAVRATGAVICWGVGFDGQLGDGTWYDTRAAIDPVTVVGISDAVAVAAGFNSCALRSNGSVTCWGRGMTGELGNGHMSTAPAPVTVSGIRDARIVALGDIHSCVGRADGTVACWGHNGNKQLGDGSNIASPVPVAVASLSDATAISSRRVTSCALRSNGQVACWGEGGFGELGNGTNTWSGIPVNVSGLSDATSVGVGQWHACAARATGGVVCWGDSRVGQLGNGGTSDSNVPVDVSGISDAVSVASGWRFSCAVRATGGIACWGEGQDGQLGNGGTSDSHVPVAVSGISDAVAIAGDRDHACAVLSTGTVVCWGDGQDGQLGNSGTSDSNVPVTVSGISDAMTVAAGTGHTCALRSTGSVVCWGANNVGQLGDGSQFSSSTPVAVAGLFDAVSVAAGGTHTCAVRATGETVCWGNGFYGQLGNGNPWRSNVPVRTLGLGDNVREPCTAGSECSTGFCVDGLCCTTACAGGAFDCQACSIAAGGSADGTCTPLAPATPCADDGNVCTADLCDGASVVCQHPAGHGGEVCQEAGACEDPGVCSGTSPVCPAPTAIPSCTAEFPDPGINVPVTINGGLSTVGGMLIVFSEVTDLGDVTVVEKNTAPPPVDEFGTVPSSPPRNWEISTTADYTPPITVCVRYTQDWFADYDPANPTKNECTLSGVMEDECNVSLVHYHTSGTGFDILPAPPPELGLPLRDTVANIVCGQTSSLSPFALVVPLDRAPPVLAGVPDTITAFATSTQGATVNYPTPTATDGFDGPVAVSCAPASGSKFPPGKTTVTCSTSDSRGNAARKTFTVWVQYQAPGDGTFFLTPIRADGSAVFKIGRAVPVKFRLTGASAGVTDLLAKLIVTRTSDRIRGAADCEGDEDGEDTDLVFKYRKAKGLYGYRWKTRGESQGTYRLHVDLGDEVVHEVDVSLKTHR